MPPPPDSAPDSAPPPELRASPAVEGPRSPAANMGRDLALYAATSADGHARFRAYRWTPAAWTFGLAQPLAAVAGAVAADAAAAGIAAPELQRRPTGGGIVDHRADWTWTLALPARAVPEAGLRAVYARVHEALGTALAARRLATRRLDEAPTFRPVDESGRARACFVDAAVDDLLGPDGRKLAGAALKAGRDAVLVQGSVAPPAADLARADPAFAAAFATALAAAFGLRAPVVVEEAALADPAVEAAETARMASRAFRSRGGSAGNPPPGSAVPSPALPNGRPPPPPSSR